jgi:CDP-paratose 2-epimerase
MSVWSEFGPLLEELTGKSIPVTYANWRPGDQPVYISDVRKVAAELGWKPTTSVRDGVTKLVDWVQANLELFA